MSSERDRAKRRTYRRRLKCGRIVLRVEVDEAGLLAALLAAGRISEAELDNRACLESAAAEILNRMAPKVGHW